MPSLFDKSKQAPRSAKTQFALLIALSLLAGTSCKPSNYPSGNPCGPYGEPWKNHEPVIAQTVESDGTVIDWVPGPIIFPGPPGVDAGPPVVVSYTQYEHQGPPGTQPVPHPKQLMCICQSDYVAYPGQPCTKLSQNCSTEGQAATAKTQTYCCPELQMIRDLRNVNGQCVDFGIDYGICARCGDGICGKGENACNCLFDCLKL